MDIVKAFDTLYPVEDKINGTPKQLIVAELDDRGYWSQARDFMDCHNRFYTYTCPDCGTEYYLPIRCKFRFCNSCGDTRFNRFAGRLSSLFEEKVKLIKNNPEYKDYRVRRLEMGLPPIDWFKVEVFDDLRECWNSLRKVYLNDKLGEFGGVYGLEVKFSRKGEIYTRGNGESYVIPETGFNFHLHAVVISDFLPQKVLSKLWSGATRGRAKYVYVDEARFWRNGLFETVKYGFKPPTLRKPEYYVDFYEDTKNMRLYAPFGCFHGVKMPSEGKGRYGCRFDSAVLIKDDMSIVRGEAVEREDGRVVPKQFIDSYLDVPRSILMPDVIRGDAL